MWHSYGPFFCDTLRQVATIVMETAQLVLSQFLKKINICNSELTTVYSYQK